MTQSRRADGGRAATAARLSRGRARCGERGAAQPRASTMRTRPDAATRSVTGRRLSARRDVHVVPHAITRSFPRALAARRTLTVSVRRVLAVSARKALAPADGPLTRTLASSAPLEPRNDDAEPALNDAEAAGASTGPTGFECAYRVPSLFVASTRSRSFASLSAAACLYAVRVAPEMFVNPLPLSRCHWYA